MKLYVEVSHIKQKNDQQTWLVPPICAVYIEYIVTIHFVRPYSNLLGKVNKGKFTL